MRKTITLKRLKKALFFSACALLLICAGWWLFTPRPPLLEDVPFSVAVYDRHSNLMRLSLAADDKYRIHTPLKKIAPSLREATLLYEDRYFYSHWGVNPIALLRAFYTTYIGGDRRMGASTISMQLARLRLNLDTTGIFGKLHQIERAFAYERHYSKDEIFEAYLNLAPYGGNIEGCGAAARIYFQKSPERLDLIESLSLVSVPQNPARRNPLAVRRMDEEGRTDAALEEARSRIHRLWLEKHPEDAGSSFMNRVRLKVYRPSDLPFNAPHVTTEALQLFPGSTGVRTTIDHRMQQLLERMIDNMVRRNRDIGVSNASALLVHWPSMEVRALVGSADFFNPAIEGQVDGTRARRSPGSTLKPFIYALALDQGLIHPRTLLYDTPRSFKGYDPENADQQFKGPVNATAALQMSRNIPAISLANALGKTPGEMDLYSFLRRAGVDFPYGRDHYGLTLVLGGAEVSMRELAELYAILPNKGKKRELVLFHPIAESGSAGDSSAIIDLGATTGSGSTTGSGATVSPEQITGEGGVLPAAQAITQDAKRNTAPAAGTTQVRIANNDTPAAVNQVAAQAASDAASAVNHTSNPDTSHAADRLLSPEASLLTLRMIRALPANQRMPGASVVQRIPMYWKTGTSNGARDAWTAGVFGPYVLVVWVGNFNNQANPHFVGVKVAAPLFWDIADAAYSQENMRDIATRDLHMPDYNG
ncbi:penicillin-binding protein 1C, partial [Desulfovibrio sp. OttesenSCG-928-C06]|nr:penicillin-binding protein 1C [Desulfovibrio sp. OttesenSCG-928-C06]